MEELTIKDYLAVLQITKELLNIAKQHDIEMVEQLIEQRNLKLKLIFQDFDNQQAMDLLAKRKILQKIFLLNQEVIQIAKARKEMLAAKIKQIKNSTKVNQIYLKLA